MIIIIIIINFFNKKVVKRNFTNGKENGVQIIVSAIVQVIAYEIEVVVFYAVFLNYAYTGIMSAATLPLVATW